jgi:hypothetical protein
MSFRFPRKKPPPGYTITSSSSSLLHAWVGAYHVILRFVAFLFIDKRNS